MTGREGKGVRNTRKSTLLFGDSYDGLDHRKTQMMRRIRMRTMMIRNRMVRLGKKMLMMTGMKSLAHRVPSEGGNWKIAI